jgi:hypothetical protein
MALGAELDGPIKYEIHGKVLCLYMLINFILDCTLDLSVFFLHYFLNSCFLQVAALRCIDGHVLGLYEPA